MSILKVRDASGQLVHLEAFGSGTEADPLSTVQSLKLTGPVRQSFFRRIDLIGDGSGSDDMNVDGSVTPVVFKFKPEVGEVARIYSGVLSLFDVGTIDAEGWGNAPPLTNGFTINVKISNVTIPLIAFPVTSIGDVASITGDVKHLAFGTGDEIITSVTNFAVSGVPIRLDGTNGDEFQIIVNDDVSYLDKQHFQVSGYYE